MEGVQEGRQTFERQFNKQRFRRFPEIPCGHCVCLFLSPCHTEGSILSTNQRTAYTQTEEYRKIGTAQSAYFGTNITNRATTYRTEPYRTARWKRGMSFPLGARLDPTFTERTECLVLEPGGPELGNSLVDGVSRTGHLVLGTKGKHL
jgi:hypothetical protein